MSKLAIVIPAYKDMYFEKALFSIAGQTCKDFTVYIGDDASPYDLRSIAAPYNDKICIIYKRFPENMGGTNLVAQWERCLEMVQEEEWIWLFSDDDLMDKNCVETFYNALIEYPDFDVFHFNIHTINQDGDILTSSNFPEVLTSEEFFYGRTRLGYHSYVVEYIFRKSYFIETGGFDYFDLAWGSDDALWIKLGKREGIKTLSNAKVSWRKSQHNISPNFKDKEILKRKFYAKIEYAEWVYQQAKNNNLRIETGKIQTQLEKTFFRDIKNNCENVPFGMIKELVFRFHRIFHRVSFVRGKLLFLYCYKVFRYFVEILKRILFIQKDQHKNILKVT